MELKGSIKKFPLPDVVQLVGSTRRTGVLTVTIAGTRASLYFEEGNLTHAEYRELRGQDVINRVFQEQEGDFQFLSDVQAEEKTFVMDWMTAIMEAARINDEKQRGAAAPAADNDGAGAWNPAAAKDRMREILEDAYGKRAKKVLKELKKCPDSRLALLEFCDKAEKYCYVFVDRAGAGETAGRLRAVVEGTP